MKRYGEDELYKRLVSGGGDWGGQEGQELLRRLRDWLLRGPAKGYRLFGLGPQDIVQETLERLLQDFGNIDQNHGMKSIRDWLKRTCRNIFVNNLRKMPKKPPPLAGADQAQVPGRRSRKHVADFESMDDEDRMRRAGWDESRDTGEQLDDRRRRARFRKVLDQLRKESPDAAEVIELEVNESDLTGEERARILGIKPKFGDTPKHLRDAYHQRLHRAKTRFGEIWEQIFGRSYLLRLDAWIGMSSGTMLQGFRT